MDLEKILELEKEFRIGTASPIKWVLSNVFLIKTVLPSRRFQGWGHSEVTVFEHRNTLQLFVSPRLIKGICLFLNSRKQFPPAVTGAAVVFLSCSTGCHCRSIHWAQLQRSLEQEPKNKSSTCCSLSALPSTGSISPPTVTPQPRVSLKHVALSLLVQLFSHWGSRNEQEQTGTSSFQKSSRAKSSWRNSDSACWQKTPLLKHRWGHCCKPVKKTSREVPFKKICNFYEI